MGSITFKPTGSLSIIENDIGGPEQANNNDDWRNLSDTVVSYTLNPLVSLMANYDYGHDTVSGTSVHWQCVAGYLKYQANKYVAVVPRIEFYNDASGFTTGVVQNLTDATSIGRRSLRSTSPAGFLAFAPSFMHAGVTVNGEPSQVPPQMPKGDAERY